MKLGEALSLRHDQKIRLAALRDRAVRSAQVQEGQKPEEDVTALINEIDTLSATHARLIARINVTNTSTGAIINGEQDSLAWFLSRRDTIAIEHKLLTEIINAGAVNQSLYSRTEIRNVATFDWKRTQARADDLAKERRELDNIIQHTNWITDLL